MYFITELLVHEQVATTIKQYSKHIYQELNYFGFDEAFINKIRSKNAETLRDYFKGNLDKPIEEIYEFVKSR
jgi:uncharacterized protein (UPF0335 family)